jgi:hypothetical protein
LISAAVSVSISRLHINTPPNAETGSQASAAFHASMIESLLAIPQALVCLRIANVGSSNSSISATAASTSTRLL